MELSEQVTALEAEKKQFVAMVENLNAEKVAIDLMLVESLKSSIQSKKDLLLAQSQIQKSLSEKEKLSVEIEKLKKEFDEYKSKYGFPTDGVLLES